MRGLYSGVNVLKPSSVSQLAEASWTATKLMNRGGVLGATGKGLAAWRALPVVPRVKQGMQVGMRLGITSQAQDLLPGYQGGVSLQDMSSEVDQAAAGLTQFGLGSVLATPVELALAPWNIFNPGTFVGRTGGLTRTAKGLWVAGGTIPGRAAAGAVIGAGAGVVAGDDPGDLVEGMTYGALAAGLLPQGARMLGRAPSAIRVGLVGAGLGGRVGALAHDDRLVALGALGEQHPPIVVWVPNRTLDRCGNIPTALRTFNGFHANRLLGHSRDRSRTLLRQSSPGVQARSLIVA